MAELENITFDPLSPLRLEYDGLGKGTVRVVDAEGRDIFFKNLELKVGVDTRASGPLVSLELVDFPFRYAGPADVFVTCDHCGEKTAVLLSKAQT